MKVRISHLSSQERELLLANVSRQIDPDFARFCVERDVPVLGCFHVSASAEGNDFWHNVLTDGDPSETNMGLLLQLTQKAVLEDLQNGTFNEDTSVEDEQAKGKAMVVGKWYGVTNGTDNNVVSVFKYNGSNSGRTGWNRKGQWVNDIDGSLDATAKLVPLRVLEKLFAAEAEKRGYDVGVDTTHGLIRGDYEHEFVESEKLSIGLTVGDMFFYRNIKVYTEESGWEHCQIVDSSNESPEKALARMLKGLGIGLN